MTEDPAARTPTAADTTVRNGLSRAVAAVVTAAGSTAAAVLAMAGVAAWLAVGVAVGFTPGWLDVLFAVSGAVTLVMVIFIQHTTARQLRAVLLKLDELVRVDSHADDRLIGAERTPLEVQENLERDGAARTDEAPGT